MKKKKLNYYRLVSVLVVFALIIFLVCKCVKTQKYEKTYEYKLYIHGYNEKEIKTLLKDQSDSRLESLLKIKYDSNIVDFLAEKYFLFKNLNKYLEYKKDSELSNTEIVALINCEANTEWIENMKDTDTSKGELMLVNRIYGLTEDYEVEDVIEVPVKYAYQGKKISESIIDNIMDLISAGEENGYSFVVSEGYRSYKDQESLYNRYMKAQGEIEADKIVARPGHSEYETGLTFDLQPYNKVIEKPLESEEYLWLKNNAYKYGFIFRFPNDKESLTQFNASTWKLRYVGSSAAETIYNENITFEEYYAFFVIGEKDE